MHELGLCSQLYDTLISVMKDEELKEIYEVTLTIGEATGVVTRFMDECWPAVVENTVLSSTKLKYNYVKVIGHCHNCENDYPVSENHGKCPKCGVEDYDMLTGYEFEVTSIKAH
ncbi:MAG: hydrogenase maturation nickel metallochaperone HypA [Bacilli bacterium]